MMKQKLKKSLFSCLMSVMMLGTAAFSSVPCMAKGDAQAVTEEKKTSDFKTSGEIWIAGDSIAADHSYENEAAYAEFVHGWGEMIGNYLTDDAKIHNLAISGETAKFFTETENYQEIMDGIGEGDFLMVSFGHNDYKSAGVDHSTLPTDTEGSYKWYLKNYYIEPALKAGAMPVLCTSVVSCYFNEDTMTILENQNHYKFVVAMRELYEEYCAQGIEIGFIDTFSQTLTLFNSDDTRSFYAVKWDSDGGTSLDHVHFSAKGASSVADMIAQNLFLLYDDFNRFNRKGYVDGGSGSSEEPYLISTWAQVYQIMQDDARNTKDTYYQLTEDLMPMVQEQEWETVFNANLDGNGHTISNPIGRSLNSFIDKNYGTISNLNLYYYQRHEASQLQYPFVQENYGTISNCETTGYLEMIYFPDDSDLVWSCGVFAGINREGGVIEDCTNDTRVIANTNVAKVYLGGIAGTNEGVISNCMNDGKLYADSSDLSFSQSVYHDEVVSLAGGIAGLTSATSEISDCSSTKLPESYTSLSADVTVVLQGKLAAVSEQELEDLLSSKSGADLQGDLDGNQIVNLTDAQLALKLALGIELTEDINEETADLDEDGVVTLEETQEILMAALGIKELL